METAYEYEYETNDFLKNKTILKADITGYGIELIFSDKSKFIYDASDGGYSCWKVIKGEK